MSVHAHRFGGTEFRIAGRHDEFAHIHGCGVVDLKLSDGIKAQIDPSIGLRLHHVYPESSVWATYVIEGKGDADSAVYILRLAYEKALGQLETAQATRRDASSPVSLVALP